MISRNLSLWAVRLSTVTLVATLSIGASFAVEASIPSESATSQLAADLRYLTSDELQGRSSVDPTIELAAAYIEQRFKQIGLDTELYDGSARQIVDIPVGTRPSSQEHNTFRIETIGSTHTITTTPNSEALRLAPLVLGTDFNPLAIGAADGVIDAPLVWVGYGINAAEQKYNDYAGVDVTGKVVMMLRKEPGPSDPNSPFGGVENTRHAFFDTKVATAIDAGAAAVIIVNDTESVRRKEQEIENRREAEQARISKLKDRVETLPKEAVNIRADLNGQIERAGNMITGMQTELEAARKGILDVTEAGMNPRRGEQAIDDKSTEKTTRPPVPVISLSRDVAAALIATADVTERPTTGDELQRIVEKIDTDYQPNSFPIDGVSVRIEVELTPSIFKSPNVIGTLPGAGDLADQTIVIGAHYDHVGMGGYASLAPGTVEIHNGADDNASGTAVMLQVADRLVKSVASLTNRRRIVCIAFTGEERGLLGSKHYVQQPRFPISRTVAMVNMDMVGRLNDNELTVYGTESAGVMDALLDDVNQNDPFELERIGSGYGPSDHASFYEAGVPVLFFFTGLHSDYHRPSDDFNKLNLDGMIRITDIVYQVSERLATMPERPEYTKTEANVQIRRQLTVFMGVQMSQQPGGVVFSSILADGPAESSGLLAGDRVVSMAGKSVSQMSDVYDQLRNFSPGDQFPLEIRRGDESLKFQIELKSR